MVKPAKTLYFYDLETSGFNPREARIMQFAGQRTDLKLRPIGKPDNIFIKLSDDVLPEPEAILVTGITPGTTQTKGLTEADFLKIFTTEIVRPGTIFTGFNNIRFDDEFMRFLLYRNFYDAYEWQWKNGSSRWDLLDVTRMTRALRPEGIKWPVDSSGAKSNQLTLLTAINKLDHSRAHDALNDVTATLSLAQLLQSKQPRLFQYLLTARQKDKVARLARSGQPFVYTSGKYPAEFEKTTVVQTLVDNPNTQGVLVYDLRHDPTPYAKLSPAELAEAWRWRPAEEQGPLPRLPIKTLQFNRCPAIAPLDRLDDAAYQRLQLIPDSIEANRQKLKAIKEWPERLLLALAILNKEQQTRLFESPPAIDANLYDGFVGSADKRRMAELHQAPLEEQSVMAAGFSDQRLKRLWPLYKARNFPDQLSDAERTSWQQHCRTRLQDPKFNRLGRYLERIEGLRQEPQRNTRDRQILDELYDWGKRLELKLA